MLERSEGWRLRLDRLKFWNMRIMTIYTQEIGPRPSVEIADPFPVDAYLPVPVGGSMTLPAKLITVTEVDLIAVGESQHVSVCRIVTVKAPARR